MPAQTAVLLDIEGTISSLPHVVTTHYPYTRRHIADYLAAHEDDPVVRKALEETKALAGRGSPRSTPSIAGSTRTPRPRRSSSFRDWSGSGATRPANSSATFTRTRSRP